MKNYAIFASFFAESIAKNQYWPESPINFFGSGVFAMGRSGYLKHGYYFDRPKETPPLFIQPRQVELKTRTFIA